MRAQAGIQGRGGAERADMDSRLRGNDEKQGSEFFVVLLIHPTRRRIAPARRRLECKALALEKSSPEDEPTSIAMSGLCGTRHQSDCRTDATPRSVF